MGNEEKSLLASYRKSQQKEKVVGDITKGYMAVKVGQDENKQQRFVVPIVYLKHPLFIKLLNVAEEEYGFEHQGAITIPCRVEEFLCVRDSIDEEIAESSEHVQHHNMAGCFGA